MTILHKQRGAAAVELALMLIPLITLTLGILQYSVAMSRYNTIAKSVRDAARYLTQYAPGDSNAIAAARCLVVTGTTGSGGTCSATALVSGLTIADVSVCDSSNCADHKLQSTGRTVVNLVTVTVTGYEFKELPFLADTLAFGDVSVTMEQL